MRPLADIVSDVAIYSMAHAPDARIVGNVRADELVRLTWATHFEFVICAAVRLPDGRVIRGHRHSDCLRTAFDLVRWEHDTKSGRNGPPLDTVRKQMGPDSQGFVTSLNRYVTRAEGFALQKAAGIESAAKGGYRGTLFSEDLY